jgi:hypothetical protein
VADALDALARLNERLIAHGLAPYRPTATFRAYVAWCAEVRVDPVLFGMARLDALGWRVRIKPEQLKSPKFLAKFEAWGAYKQGAEVSNARRSAQVVRVDGVDIHPDHPNYAAIALARHASSDLAYRPIDSLSWYERRHLDPQRLQPQQERARRGYLADGKAETCMQIAAYGDGYTAGWHPYSATCGACPVAAQCRAATRRAA